MEPGKGSSSVGEYEYRDKIKKGQKLVIKKINYLSPGVFAFGSEKMAKDVISKETLKNGSMLDHFTLVKDYHYGLTSAFVVYDKANKYDWKLKMLDEGWSNGKKSKWLADVFTQVLDCSLFLYNNGLVHGDLNCSNYNLDIVDNKPYVRIFDYGLLHRIVKNPFARQSLNWELEKILKGFIVQYCYYFDLGGIDKLRGDNFFELIKRNDIKDNNFQALVDMYNEIRGTYITLGNLCVALKLNIDQVEFEDKIKNIRSIIDNMASNME